MQVVEQYKKDKCDSKGNILQRNLSVEVDKGIKELKERRKAGDIIVCSDKSDKIQ